MRSHWHVTITWLWFLLESQVSDQMASRIYLAGPDVFLVNAVEVGRRKQLLCRQFGFEGLYPLDQDETVQGAAEIFRANVALMGRADIGLVNLTPFRGPSADVGTAFELPWLM